MSRVQRLRSMGMDWAADLIETLEADKTKLQDAIKSSPEFTIAAGHSNAPGSGFDDMESDF